MFSFLNKGLQKPQPKNAAPNHHSQFREIQSESDFEQFLSNDFAVLFKHSPSCVVSRAAHREVVEFAEQNPAVPVHLLHVLRDRDLSLELAARTKVRHESPQTIIFRDGKVIAAMSHQDVTADELERLLAPPT